MLRVYELEESILNNLEAHKSLFDAIETAVSKEFCPTIDVDRRETPSEMVQISKSDVDNLDHIYVHGGFLQYLWNISYALFYIYQEALEKPKRQSGGFKIDENNPLLLASIDLICISRNLSSNWAEKDIREKIDEITDIPNANRDVLYPKLIDSIYVWAVTFGILHEMGHSENYHLYCAVDKPEDEFVADDFAASKLAKNLSKSETTTVIFGAIALYVTCGLIEVDKGDKRPLHGSSTHPNVDERIQNIISKLHNYSAANEDVYYGISGIGIFITLSALKQRNKIRSFNLPKSIDTNKSFYEFMHNEYRQCVDSCPELD